MKDLKTSSTQFLNYLFEERYSLGTKLTIFKLAQRLKSLPTTEERMEFLVIYCKSEVRNKETAKILLHHFLNDLVVGQYLLENGKSPKINYSIKDFIDCLKDLIPQVEMACMSEEFIIKIAYLDLQNKQKGVTSKLSSSALELLSCFSPAISNITLKFKEIEDSAVFEYVISYKYKNELDRVVSKDDCKEQVKNIKNYKI